MVVRSRVIRLLLPLLVVGGGCALPGCADGTPAIPPGISDERAMELGLARYAYDLDLLMRRYPDATVPMPVELVMVATRDEWSQAQVRCLTERGIVGARTTSGGYAVLGENDPQEEAVARFVCRYQVTLDPRVLGALSPEQAGYAYDYLTDRIVPCMQSIGFEPSPAVDREAFIAYSARVWGAALWTPYGRLDDPFAGPEREFVDSRCPPLPDDPFAVFNGTLSSRVNGDG